MNKHDASDWPIPVKLPDPLEEFLAKVREELREGLMHGFYKCEIDCKIVKEQRREIVIRAGKTWKFYVTKEDAERCC